MINRECPYRDFKGNRIFEDDKLIHPVSEEIGTVVWQDKGNDYDSWLLDYNDGTLSRLSLQVQEAGQASLLFDEDYFKQSDFVWVLQNKTDDVFGGIIELVDEDHYYIFFNKKYHTFRKKDLVCTNSESNLYLRDYRHFNLYEDEMVYYKNFCNTLTETYTNLNVQPAYSVENNQFSICFKLHNLELFDFNHKDRMIRITKKGIAYYRYIEKGLVKFIKK